MKKSEQGLIAAAAAAGVAALAGGVFWATRDRRTPGGSDDAPGRTARHGRFGDYAVVGKTVLINKPSRQQLYAFWRDFTNLPAFMENLERVEMLDGERSRWVIRAPAGRTVTIVSRIAEEREGELIAWRSEPESDIDTEGRVKFRDAPGDRGTYVELIIAYDPPMGRAGQAVAKLLQREPEEQARRDLRRLKMLMETGEIATSARRLEEMA